jgi:hypothetical protein
MWAKASIFRIGPFWPPRRTRTLVVDDGRVLTLDEPAVIDEALALGDKLGGAANLQQQRECAARSPRQSLVTRERASTPLEAGLLLAGHCTANGPSRPGPVRGCLSGWGG